MCARAGVCEGETDVCARGEHLLCQDFLAYKTIIKAKESAGISLSFGISFFEDGRLQEDDFLRLVESNFLAQEEIKAFQICSTFSKDRYDTNS